MLTETAPAKINLGLNILRKRQDGYHDLCTVFHPIGWADKIAAAHAEAITMTCTDSSLSCGDDNLVIQAAKLLDELIGINRGACIHLEKRVPHGAGLGGGSSDAATTLHLLCQLWELGTPNELDSIALSLGSDVPFFLHKVTSYAQGRGEILVPLRDYSFPFSLVVIVHPIHIPTAWAFQQITPSEANFSDLVETVRSNDLDRWSRELVNDFEGPVFSQWPILQETKSLLLNRGAGYASLTGSGSAVFGVFESCKDAQKITQDEALEDCTIWCEP